jgi:UPF0755 protein
MKPSKRLIAFLVISILGISFVFYGFQVVYTPNFLLEQEDRIIKIESGATFKDVQRIMHEGRYVNDLVSFSFLARLMDYDENVKPGRFKLTKGMSNLEAIRTLRSGKQEPVKVTFNNVRLPSELAEKVTRNLTVTKTEFEAELAQFAANNQHGFNKDNIISMFIPNTYEVYQNTMSTKNSGVMNVNKKRRPLD